MGRIDLEKLLSNMECSELNYGEWLNVGMGLKEEGYPLGVWDDWSRTDSRYRQGECERKWNGFRSSGITGATITQIAKDHGWFFPLDPAETFSWDSEIEYDGAYDSQLLQKKMVDISFVGAECIPEPGNDPELEIERYIKALFKPGDRVAYNSDAYQDEDGKWKPKGRGTSRSYEDIISELEKGKKLTDIFYPVQGVTEHAGMWVRVNPMKAGEVGNAGVTSFRHVVVESDSMDIEKQYAMIKTLNLPVAALVHSGGKSLHAIIKIDAINEQEYKKRVRFLYDYCKRNDFKIDEQNKNPSRLSRLPGVMRGDKKQYLIGCDLGTKSWTEWRDYVGEEQDDLPDIESFEAYMDNLPPLAPELIEGILRKGHKMILAGPSKAGKSFGLINLAISIADGIPWWGWKCSMGKVLYINLELDSASCIHRFADIMEARNVRPEHPENIRIWNLRGKSQTMESLTPRLIRRIKDQNYAAVILDPIYKVTAGDENSAEAMGRFCNALDRVANEVGCSVIYCHHHSKGAQSGKSSIDRASGSGVFARDADCIVDMLELEVKEDIKEDQINSAWEINCTVREFKSPPPKKMFFEYPLHRIDDNGLLDKARTMEASRAGKLGNDTRRNEKTGRVDDLKSALDSGAIGFGEYPTLQEAAEYMGVSTKSIRNYLKDIPDYKLLAGGKGQGDSSKIVPGR